MTKQNTFEGCDWNRNIIEVNLVLGVNCNFSQDNNLE